MEFKKKNNDSLFEETHTSNGNTISFVSYHDIIPKSIMIYNSFEITGSMTELLHSSKVLKVDSFYNNNKQIKILPLFGFSLDKLKDILIDLCSKFNL